MADIDTDLDDLIATVVPAVEALDPRETWPFWDFDMAPTFSSEWVALMGDLIGRDALQRPVATIASEVSGPSVLRKELVYQLFDLQVADTPEDERLSICREWVDVLRRWCGADWLSRSGNDDATSTVASLFAHDVGSTVDAPEPRQRLLQLVVAAQSLAWMTFTDVFVQQGCECLGPYPDGDAVIVEWRFRGLDGGDIWPSPLPVPWTNFSVLLRIVGSEITIDPYNHLSSTANLRTAVTDARLVVGSDVQPIDDVDLAGAVEELRASAVRRRAEWDPLDEAARRRLWIRARHASMQRLLRGAGLTTSASDLVDGAAGRPLHDRRWWREGPGRPGYASFLAAALDPRRAGGYDYFERLFVDLVEGAR